MTELETPRLRLRRLTPADADLIVALLNEPTFIRFIGDRGVRTTDDARNYLAGGPLAMYDAHGFGLGLMERKSDDLALGICGLVKREGLNDPDIGFALFPEFVGQGYAFEAASAVLNHAREVLRLPRVAAIVSPENAASKRLLERLGLVESDRIRLTPEAADVLLYMVRWEHAG